MKTNSGRSLDEGTPQRAFWYISECMQEQTEDVFSREYQEGMMEAFCTQRGYRCVKGMRDKYTGNSSVKHPGFFQAYKLLKTLPEIQHLICVNLDGFSRVTPESLMMLVRLKKIGVHLHSLEPSHEGHVAENFILEALYNALPERKSGDRINTFATRMR